jgi:hypothetical protein
LKLQKYFSPQSICHGPAFTFPSSPAINWGKKSRVFPKMFASWLWIQPVEEIFHEWQRLWWFTV